MRRLIISILAAGLAAGTLFSATGAASASRAAAHHRAGCTTFAQVFLHVNKSGVNYFVGTPNTTFAGAVVRLKPQMNITTHWTGCLVSGDEILLFNRNLVLTSSGIPGSDVTVEHVLNFGNGTARQRWHATISPTGDTVVLRNVKSSQFLRVRNSGPVMGQTVTTGFTPTTWLTR